MYARGHGVSPSFERARHWFERAAAQGSADAHRNLGVMYLKGFGVEQDTDRARRSFETAANEDPVSARILVAMQEEGLVDAPDALGEEWLTAAAVGGNIESQALLGTRLLQRGDESEAVRWLESAATGGAPSAQLLFGWMLLSGRGVEKDVDAARIWIETAAASGEPGAQASAAFGIVTSAGGSPCEEHVRDAALWMHAAADAGLPAAQYNLALMMMRGEGVPRSYRESVRWLQAAAAQGYKPARSRLDALGERVPLVRSTPPQR